MAAAQVKEDVHPSEQAVAIDAALRVAEGVPELQPYTVKQLLSAGPPHLFGLHGSLGRTKLPSEITALRRQCSLSCY